MIRIALMLFVFFVAAPAWAQAASDLASPPAVQPDERRAVALLLSAVHELPSRAEFEKVSAQPLVVLTQMAAGRGPLAERAVEAMFMWPTEQTFAVARAQLADDKTPSGRRHRLLLLVAGAFGDRATDLVTPHLANEDAQLRTTAAAAVAKIRTHRAFAALDAAIAAERSELVAAEMRRYARRILQ